MITQWGLRAALIVLRVGFRPTMVG